MKIIDVTSGKIIGDRIQLANRFLPRLKGLMFRDHLDPGEGILLYPCNSIHMFFMKIPLDILFLDEDMVVLKQINGIKPWQISTIVKNAKYVLELGYGSFQPNDRLEGHQLSLLK
ncbi:MAG: DUF192 domain-containing protein [Clostridia bacterium]